MLFSFQAYADLYITTEYFQDTEPDKPISTPHHLFLNKPYDVRYWKMSYRLTLKKIEGKRVTIESESFFIGDGKKTFLAGGISSAELSKPIELKQFGKNGKLKFKLKIIPDKFYTSK